MVLESIARLDDCLYDLEVAVGHMAYPDDL
jgi:hypothetical protein